MDDIDKVLNLIYNKGEEGKHMAHYGYSRVSTETQAEKGYGLAEQEAAIRKYASDNGLTVEAVFTDAGISGNIKDTEEHEAIHKRAGLMELLAVLRQGDTVIVRDTSRLWRSDMAKALIRRELMKRGARVVSLAHPDYDLYKTSKDPSAYLTNAIMEALDVYERMSIALKLARGRTVKAVGGDKPAGVCPFGYRYTADKKSVEVDPVEADAVRFMFSEGQKGKSLRSIADALNAQGIHTRRGCEWGSGNVQVILRNRFYIGELSHQGKPIKGKHSPIVSKVQFGKCQAQLDRRRKL